MRGIDSGDSGDRPRRRRVPWGAIGMVGLVIAFELFVSRHGLMFMDSASLDWMNSGRAASRKAGRYDVLVFGDSMIKFGLAPRVLEERLGPEHKVFNLGLLDGKPSLSYLLFKRAIEAGAQPSAVIVDFAPEGLKQPSWHLITNPHWNALRASVSEAWEFAAAFQDREFFGRLVAADVLPSFRCRGQIRCHVLSALQGQDPADSTRDNPPFRRNTRVNGGGILLPKQPGFRGEVPPQWAGDLMSDEFAVAREQARFVRRLFALANEHGIKVFWLLPPNAKTVMAQRDRNGVHAKYDEFARSLLERFPTLSVIDARHADYPDTVFVDPVHLDRDGAIAVSTAVAEAIRPALAHAGPPARWVTLPSGHDRAPSVALSMEDVDQSRAALKRREESRQR